jgi:hypothetical protein
MQYNKKVHGLEEKITAKCTLRLLPLRVLSKSFVSQIYDANIPPTSWGCGLNYFQRADIQIAKKENNMTLLKCKDSSNKEYSI